MIRTIQVVVGAVALTAIAPNCASLSSAFAEPTAELGEVQITAIGLQGGTLNLLVDITNPNSFDLRGVGLELAVDLDGTEFGQATYPSSIQLTKNDVTRIELPLDFRWTGVGAGARSLLNSGKVPYTLRGTVNVDTPIGQQPVSLSTEGSVDLRRMIG